MNNIKFVNLPAQYKTVKQKIDKAVLELIKNGKFILGDNGKKLEEQTARLVGTKYAIGVNSGTDALLLSLKALGIKEGDEVITTPFSFIATAEAIANCGARPIFADIDSKTCNIDAKKIEKAITKKTRAIIPVHLYGQMADMRAIMQIAKRRKLFVIEDAAQALGAKMQTANGKWQMAGSFGNADCFSFFPTKNLGAAGDAGMITTNNQALAEKLKMMRNHGARKKYYHEFLGVSSRLDELQAAVILIKLPFLKKWNEKRRSLANFYTKNLSGIARLTTPFIAKNNYHIFHQYTIRTKYRDDLRVYLETKGIASEIHYPLPLHLQPAFKYLGYKNGDFPEAERAANEVLSLPVYPELKLNGQKIIVKKIKEFFA